MTQVQNNVVEEIYDEIGELAFQAALLRFVPDLPVTESEAFLSYIEENVEKNTFMEDLYRDYPGFGILLDEEL